MKTLFTLAALSAFLSMPTPAAEKSGAAPKSDGSTQISITLGDLYQAQESLGKLFKLELPIKTAWSLRKTVAAVESEMKRFNDQRSELLKKYGAADKDGNTIIPPDKVVAANADFKQLQEIKVELTITPVSLSMLGDGAKLTASDMQRLEPFLVP